MLRAAQQTPRNVTETNPSRESEMLECVIKEFTWREVEEKWDLDVTQRCLYCPSPLEG